MKATIVFILVMIVSFIHGFYVPSRVFPDNFGLQILYALFTGSCIGSLGACIINSMES